MFKWSVVISTQNQQGGVAQTIEQKDTKKQAEDLYFDKLSQLGGNPQVRFVRCELKNEYGELVKVDLRENEPIVEQEETE